MTLDPSAPIRLWDELWIDDINLPADLPARRRVALAEAVAHAEPVTGDGRGTVGVRRYGPGCMALALGGCFDRDARDLLQALSDEVPSLAHREIALDLSGLERCDAMLARAIGRLRIRCLTREARVELHDPPAALAVELGRPVIGRGPWPAPAP